MRRVASGDATPRVRRCEGVCQVTRSRASGERTSNVSRDTSSRDRQGKTCHNSGMCMSRPTTGPRPLRNARLLAEQGCGEVGLHEAHGFRRRRQLRLELALVEPAAEELPAGQTPVHQRIEARTVVRRLEMRELVDCRSVAHHFGIERTTVPSAFTRP